jgi:hypothetical protein
VERAIVAFLEEPQNIEKALTYENSKECECAMQKEYDSLMTNNTWTLVPLPAGRKPVSCKWVFKIKQSANGEVERFAPSSSSPCARIMLLAHSMMVLLARSATPFCCVE